MALAIVEKIEQHPYIAAGVVFTIGAALVIYMSSGSSAPASAPAGGYTLDNSSETVAATQIQQSQIAAGVAENHDATQLQAVQATDAMNIALAQIAGQVQTNGQNLQADTINKQTTAGVAVAGLQAGVQMQSTALATQVAIANTNAGMHAQDVLANAYSQQSTNATQISLAQINALTTISATQAAATAAADAKAHAKTLAIATAQTAVDRDIGVIHTQTPAWQNAYWANPAGSPQIPYWQDVAQLNQAQAM